MGCPFTFLMLTGHEGTCSLDPITQLDGDCASLKLKACTKHVKIRNNYMWSRCIRDGAICATSSAEVDCPMSHLSNIQKSQLDGEVGLLLDDQPQSRADSHVRSNDEILRSTAFVLGCYAHQTSLVSKLTNVCLASACSLLQTTTPRHAFMMVDPMMNRALRPLLLKNGMRTMVVPPIDVSRIRRDGQRWVAAREKQAKRPRMLNLSVYSAHKFNAWTLLGYERVLYADGTDVLFQHNASHMATDYEPFAAVRMRNSSRCPDLPFYMNAGVVLLRPSKAARDVLFETYYRGNYTYCGGSGGYLGDQDVMTSVAAAPHSVLGDFSEMSICHNYRGWHEQLECNPRNRTLLHTTPHAWPKGLNMELANMARRGECRSPQEPVMRRLRP